MRTTSADLEKMHFSDLFDNTCKEIENRYHVKFYTYCGRFCSDIDKYSDEVYYVVFSLNCIQVQATSKAYVEYLRACTFADRVDG